MEVKTDWIKTATACITGVVYSLLKIFLPAYFIFSLLENIIIWLFSIFSRRMAGIGYIFRNTICQGPDIFTTLKYLCIDYIQDHKKVADIFTRDFRELVIKSLAKYPVLYIKTNSFVYRNVLLPLQDEGVLELETMSGYKAPQVIEKVQIMDWYSVVKCIWDKKALQRLFQMEMINKYRLKRVDSHV